MTARLPKWPPTLSPLLGELKTAMRSRSKALRHQLQHWTCERLTDEVDGRTSESLAVDFHSYRAEYRLRLWDDGVLWFLVRQVRARRVVFELSFDGSVGDAPVSDVVRAVEASFVPGNVRAADTDATQDEILRIWAAFDPENVNRGRR